MEELMLDVSQAHEFKLACRKAGYSNADIKKMCEGNILVRLLPAVRGLAEVVITEHIVDLDADPLIPYDGWKVESHKKGGKLTLGTAKFQPYWSSNQKEGKTIKGDELLKALEGQPNLNANLLDYWLDHPDLIPEELKTDANGGVLYTCFWDTIYRGAGGRRYVRGLYFCEGHWQARCYWLDFDFGAIGPALQLAS